MDVLVVPSSLISDEALRIVQFAGGLLGIPGLAFIGQAAWQRWSRRKSAKRKRESNDSGEPPLI